MEKTSLEFHGVHVMEPENELCALLRWVEGNKILPVWLSPLEGSRVMQRLDGYSETRPNTHDLLLEFIEMAGGVGSIEIVNYYEGTFMIDIVDETGEVHDAKLTDALVVSEHFGVPITVVQELLNKVSVFVTADDMEAYFGFHFDPPVPPVAEEAGETLGSDSSASGNPQADADFEAMMRSLGVSEEDFLEENDGKETNDTRVTNDDNGDKEV